MLCKYSNVILFLYDERKWLIAFFYYRRDEAHLKSIWSIDINKGIKHRTLLYPFDEDAYAIWSEFEAYTVVLNEKRDTILNFIKAFDVNTHIPVRFFNTFKDRHSLLFITNMKIKTKEKVMYIFTCAGYSPAIVFVPKFRDRTSAAKNTARKQHQLFDYILRIKNTITEHHKNVYS